MEKFNRENRPHMTTFWQNRRDLHAGKLRQVYRQAPRIMLKLTAS